MKRFGQGFIVGVLVTILLTSGIVMAADPIRLFVNGQEIQTDVAPQLISGRVMVPAKYVAEPLGANVMWDSVGRSVIISGPATQELPGVNQAPKNDVSVLNLGETANVNGIKINVDNVRYVKASPYGGKKAGFVMDVSIENNSNKTLEDIGGFKFEFEIDNEMYRDEVNSSMKYFDGIKAVHLYPGEKKQGTYKLVTERNIKMTKIIYYNRFDGYEDKPMASWEVNN